MALEDELVNRVTWKIPNTLALSVRPPVANATR